MTTGISARLLIISALLAGMFLYGCSGTERDPSGDDCNIDFSYTIGQIDSRFGISEEEVQEAMNRALALWAGAADSLTVRRSADANNTVRFIYDERQQYSDQAKQFHTRIQARNVAVDRLRDRYERSKKVLATRTAEHQELVGRVADETERFNTWTEEVNRAGGFTEEQMPRYRRKRENLEQLGQSERQSQVELNRMIDDFNQLTDRLNREVDRTNEMVDEFNDRFGEAYHFEGANYEGNGRRGVISVYHFDDRRELTVLLAHEIGHAIGLGHVGGTGSIMFETIADQLDGEIGLSEEDRKAVDGLCR